MNLSNMTLKEYLECPYCFYLDKKLGIKKPPPIMAGITNALDRSMKSHYDELREEKRFPNPQFKALCPGWVPFQDQAALKKMRHWKSGLKYENPQGFTLIGAFDDLMFDPKNLLYMPLDHKSKGKETNEEETVKYYQFQGDVYSLLLYENGYPVCGKAAFNYYRPGEINEDLSMAWEPQLIVINADRERAREVFNLASDCLISDKAPQQTEGCAMCSYVARRASL